MPLPPEQSTGNERRGHKTAIPGNLDQLLTQEQQLTLNRVAGFGWQLAFIRRPLFQAPVAVVTSAGHQRFAVLEGDGEVNMLPDIILRH